MGLQAFEEAAADGKMGSRGYLKSVFEGVKLQRVVAKRMDTIQAIISLMDRQKQMDMGVGSAELQPIEAAVQAVQHASHHEKQSVEPNISEDFGDVPRTTTAPGMLQRDDTMMSLHGEDGEIDHPLHQQPRDHSGYESEEDEDEDERLQREVVCSSCTLQNAAKYAISNLLP